MRISGGRDTLLIDSRASRRSHMASDPV